MLYYERSETLYKKHTCRKRNTGRSFSGFLKSTRKTASTFPSWLSQPWLIYQRSRSVEGEIIYIIHWKTNTSSCILENIIFLKNKIFNIETSFKPFGLRCLLKETFITLVQSLNYSCPHPARDLELVRPRTSIIWSLDRVPGLCRIISRISSVNKSCQNNLNVACHLSPDN